jgi:hypothetical protein
MLEFILFRINEALKCTYGVEILHIISIVYRTFNVEVGFNTLFTIYFQTYL